MLSPSMLTRKNVVLGILAIVAVVAGLDAASLALRGQVIGGMPRQMPSAGTMATSPMPGMTTSMMPMNTALKNGTCTSDADCKDPMLGVCDSGKCVECKGVQNNESDGSNPRCTKAQKLTCSIFKKCVECESTSKDKMSGINPACKDPAAPACDSNKCVECATTANNKEVGTNPACKDPAAPVCDQSKCVACTNLANKDDGTNPACKDPAAPVCNSYDECVACDLLQNNKADGTNPACKDPAAPVCNDDKCVECRGGLDKEDGTNPSCKDPQKPACNVFTSRCEECVAPNGASGVSEDCKDPMKTYCQNDKCVECSGLQNDRETGKNPLCADQKKSTCSIYTHKCVECVLPEGKEGPSSDCKNPEKNYCNLDGECIATPE